MKKVIIKDKEYIINPEEKMVIGKMDKDPRIHLGDNYKQSHKMLMAYAHEIISHDELMRYFMDGENLEYKVIAKCDERDEFDERTGVDICEEKLERKKHLHQARVLDRMHRLLVEAGVIAYNECVKHINKANAITEDLERMYGGDKVES